MLSIIIVNYHSEKLVYDCLRSIYAQEVQSPFEIIIVSNGTTVEGKQNILNQFAEILWIDMSYNAGFARANNEGIRHSKGDTVLLLNPDVIVEENAIEISYQRLCNSDYIACGVQLLNEDRTPQISGNYFMTGGLNHLLPLPVIGKILGWFGKILQVKKTNVPEATETVDVHWINGAYLMVKKSAIEKAGLMDEDFFLYAEEIEWCARLYKNGNLCIYGDLHIVHLQGEVSGSTSGESGKGYYNLFNNRGKQLMVSNFLRIKKQFGNGWLLVHMFFYAVEIPLFFLFALVGELLKLDKAFSTRNFMGFCKNYFIVLSLLPKITSGRPHFYKVM